MARPLRPSSLLRLCSLLFVLFAATAAVADDPANANRRFVAAVLDWNAAAALAGDDVPAAERRVALLEGVAANLDRIIRDHAGSDLAVRLVIGEAIGPLSLAASGRALAEARARLSTAQCLASPRRACLLAKALATARAIRLEQSRARALEGIAWAQAETGLISEALATARAIEDYWHRAQALRDIAKAQADPGLFAEAVATARAIEDEGPRAERLAAIARAQAEAGRFAEAVATARAIEEDDSRAFVLAEIARLLPE